jgi:hypothetical protein
VIDQNARLKAGCSGMKALNSLTSGGSAVVRPLDIIVRASTEDDVPAMLAIYAHHIQLGLGETDTEPLHGDDIKRRRKNMLKHRLPHLVAELNGAVIGYAYAVPFRKRRPTAIRSSTRFTSTPIISMPASAGVCCRS